MNIGEAAASGLPAKSIRHYEEIGLVPARRAANFYGSDGPDALRYLGVVARARSLGFSPGGCRAPLALRRDRNRASAEVRTFAMDQLSDIDRTIAALQAMRRTLAHLVATCCGDDRPDSPILDDLAPDAGPPPEAPRGATRRSHRGATA